MKVAGLTAIALALLLPIFSQAATAEPLDREGVKALQECLNKKGFSAGVADGIAGQKTIAAARDFKKAALAKNGKSGQIAITDDIDKDVLLGCTFYDPSDSDKPQILKGSLPVTSSTDDKTYPLTWEAEEQKYFGFTVRYYFGNDAKDISRFRFQGSSIRYQCEDGTEEEKMPKGAFRKGNHAPRHKDVCGGKKGDLVSVSYGQ